MCRHISTGELLGAAGTVAPARPILTFVLDLPLSVSWSFVIPHTRRRAASFREMALELQILP